MVEAFFPPFKVSLILERQGSNAAVRLCLNISIIASMNRNVPFYHLLVTFSSLLNKSFGVQFFNLPQETFLEALCLLWDIHNIYSINSTKDKDPKIQKLRGKIYLMPFSNSPYNHYRIDPGLKRNPISISSFFISIGIGGKGSASFTD